jgi:hypothetical protein
MSKLIEIGINCCGQLTCGTSWTYKPARLMWVPIEMKDVVEKAKSAENYELLLKAVQRIEAQLTLESKLLGLIQENTQLAIAVGVQLRTLTRIFHEHDLIR